MSNETIASLRSPSTELFSPDREEQSRQMVGISADLVYLTSSEGAMCSANPAMAKIFECRAQDLVGRQFGDLFPPDLTGQTWTSIRDHLDRNDLLVFEHPLRNLDSEILFETRLAPIRTPSGQVHEIVGVTRELRGSRRLRPAGPSESVLQATIEYMSDGLLVTCEGYRVSHFNARFLEIWSIPPGIISTMDDQVLLHYVLPQLVEPEQFMAITKEIYQTLDRTEDTLTFKDGRIIERRSYPLRFPGQEVARVWLFRDVSERKRAEEAKQMEQTLRQHEKKIHSIFSAAPAGVGIVVNRIFTECNDRFCEMMGYTREEILGQNARIFYLSNEEFERIGVEEVRDMAGKAPLQTETQWRKKDGTVIDGLLSFAHIDPDDPSKGGIFAALDISARKRAEEALRREQVFTDAVLDSVPGLLYLYDDQGHLIRWNKKHEEMTGYSSEELARMNLLDWYKDEPEDIARITAGVQKALQEGYAEEEGNLQTKDGTKIRVHFTAVRLHIDDKVYFAGIGIDITGRKRADEQLARSLRETQVRLAVSQALSGKETEDEVLDALMLQAGLYPEGCVSITTLDTTGKEPVGTWRRVDSRQSGLTGSMPVGTRLPAPLFPIIRLVVTGQPLISDDILADARLDPVSRDLYHQIGACSVAAFPLMLGSECLGILGVAAKPHGFIDDEKQTLYRTIAEQGAVALRAARLREKTRESEQRLSLFVQQSPLAAIEWNRNLEVVSWNPAAEEIFGYSRGAALGRHARELILPQALIRQIDQIGNKDLAQQGGTRSINENLTKDGRAITCEWFNAPLVGPDGQVLGVASLVEDITERIRSEEALRENEEKYRALFESANDCIHLIDGDRWVECNSRGLTMYGCISRVEMIGTTPADFSPPTQPDGRDSLEKARELIDAARDGRPQRFYWKHQRKDGVLMDVEVSLNRLVLGQKVYVLAIERDITERKRAEDALRASEAFLESIIEEAPFGAHSYELQSDGRLVFLGANRSADKILSLDHTKFVGRTIEEAFPGLVSTPIPELYRKVAAGGEPVVTERASYQKDQISGVYEIHAFHTGFNRMTAFFQDITERKKSEMALRSSLEEKEALLKEVHHRVKNNLQIVTSLLRLQAGREQQESVKAALRDMQSRVGAMALLHEALYRSPNLAQVDFGAYVENLCAQLARTYLRSSKPAKLEVRISNIHLDLERAVPCGLIISELVTNAYKHAFPDNCPGTILVGAEKLNDDEIELSVTDSGVGLPANFDPARTHSLGVQLVFRLTGQLGGHLHFTEGPGASLRIRLPIRQKVSPAPHAGSGDQSEP